VRNLVAAACSWRTRTRWDEPESGWRVRARQPDLCGVIARSLPLAGQEPAGGYPCCVNRSALAGPDGHPFHPLLVPLPIGAFVSSLIFDILARTRADGLPYLVDGAFWLIGIGLISALAVAVFGVLDLRTIPRDTPAFATARAHLALNAATAVLFAVSYSWRAGDHVELDKTRWGQLALSAVGVAFLMAAMWLGGKLTYHHGVRVTGHVDHDQGATRRG
jgi:uncharacterized membrane protein